ncbi:hypothetical protein JYB88_00375 [Shewanella cyperi]|uniref:Uncharacterized protein n=1 Tax=Shewanella cyperi TaxID=2814292 RepID=A0A974XKN6_9GAMM|nr:hypothetical protein [Shewanella cyperi]QSX30175.1 hypothetical protein JYB88_00375 [Shewanella cyperi]
MKLSSLALLVVVALGCFCAQAFAKGQPPEKYTQFLQEYKPKSHVRNPEFEDWLYAAINVSILNDDNIEQDIVQELQNNTGMNLEEVSVLTELLLRQYQFLKARWNKRDPKVLERISREVSESILSKNYSPLFVSEVLKYWHKFGQCPRLDLINAIASKSEAYQIFMSSEKAMGCEDVAASLLGIYGPTPDVLFRIADIATLNQKTKLLLKKKLFEKREWFASESASLFLTAIYLNELYAQAYMDEFLRVLNSLDAWQRMSFTRGTLAPCPIQYCGSNHHGNDSYYQFDDVIIMNHLLKEDQFPSREKVTLSYSKHQMEYTNKQNQTEMIERFQFGSLVYDLVTQEHGLPILKKKNKSSRGTMTDELLRYYLAAHSPDVYDYFFGVPGKPGTIFTMPFSGPVVSLLGAKLAKREGYPAIAGYLLNRVEKDLFLTNHFAARTFSSWDEVLMPYLADARFEGEIEAERTAWFAKIKAELGTSPADNNSWLAKIKAMSQLCVAWGAPAPHAGNV